MKLGVPADSARQIATFLVGCGLLTEGQLSRAAASSIEGGKGLIDTIIEFGFANEHNITNAISEFYELDIIDLNDEKSVDLSAVAILPKKYIIENRVIPIRCNDGRLDIAISEPAVLNLMANIKLLTDKEIHTYITTFSQIDQFLANIEDLSVAVIESEKENVVENEVNKSQARSSLVIDFVDKNIKEAVKLGASDIHLEIYKRFARMRFRIMGVLIDQKEWDEELFENYKAIVTRIKIMSKLKIQQTRLPQDGKINLKVGDRDIDLRISILPTSFGERVVIRILATESMSLESLGFQEEDEQSFKNAVDAPQGMVLVTGPTGSGKSTTLYAALERINHDEINILTAEDPVEFTIDGVGQVHVKEDIGLTFSAALRSFLRQDPEVVMVGEIRDKETVDIAIKAALTGHLVLSTLHTNDAVSTITRLINMGVAPYLITSSLTLVVAQRLARKVCEHCKVEDDSVTEGQLISVGFTPEESSRTILYHGSGCQQCNNSGDKGRKGIYEVLKITENIKEGILNELTTPELLRVAKKKDNFSTMQEVGRGFLLQGAISMREYQRILMAE